jgi:hypothetical protein
LQALAAVLGQIIEQRVHRRKTGRIDHRPAVSPHRHKPRLSKAIKMKRQGVRGHIECLSDLSGRHAFWSCLDEQAEGVKPAVLRKRGQSRDGIFLSHTSTNIEMLLPCQPLFRLLLKYAMCQVSGWRGIGCRVSEWISAQSNKRQDRGDEKPNDHGGDQNQCNSFGQSFAHEKSFRADAWSNEHSLL